MKVLIVVNNLRVANGVATVIMNQYDSLIQAGYEVDFLQFLDFDSPYVKKIQKNGGIIWTIKKEESANKQIKRLLKENKYDIIHINHMSYSTILLAINAKVKKIKNIIYHSHNTKIPGGIKRRVLEKICNITYSLCANRYIACSEKAGKDAFGKRKFTILKNSIDVSKFRFDKNNRSRIREELKISDNSFVVGTVCRYAKQKNPILMIDIMDEVIKNKPDTYFLWIGSAPSVNDPIAIAMNERIKEFGIEDRMKWVGSKSDIYNWYSAMDLFLMPSLWEGLGITYIEAQANSLPVFASDVVPKDTKITENIKYFPLDMSIKEWAENILTYNVRNSCDLVQEELFTKAGYDSRFAKEDLLKIYNSFYA